jgi:serine/threonine protein kinase
VRSDENHTELLRWLRGEMGRSAGELLGSGYQAIVHRYRGPFGDIVVKSPHDKGVLAWLARRAIKRESDVYARLDGVPGIARSWGLLDDRHLVLEYVGGPSLRRSEKQLQDRQAFFAALLATIEMMHSAGVAHGDLKRKDNILVGPGERPYVIDFGIARLRKRSSGPVFEWVRQMDYNAWTKLKYGRRLENLSADDAARYRPLWLERAARWIRVPWQKLTLRRPRQRWRARRNGR